MTGEGVDIGDELNLARAGSSAADAAREGDDKAAVAALIGTDLQEFRPGDAVEASPVEAVVRMVNLAGDGGHQGNRIGFATGQRPDGLHDVLHVLPPALEVPATILDWTTNLGQKETTGFGGSAAGRWVQTHPAPFGGQV